MIKDGASEGGIGSICAHLRWTRSSVRNEVCWLEGGSCCKERWSRDNQGEILSRSRLQEADKRREGKYRAEENENGNHLTGAVFGVAVTCVQPFSAGSDDVDLRFRRGTI